MSKDTMGAIAIALLFTVVFLLVITTKRENKEFKENYRIDLKQNGYLVYKSHNGEVVFVAKDSLELFFLDDNL